MSPELTRKSHIYSYIYVALPLAAVNTFMFTVALTVTCTFMIELSVTALSHCQ